MRVNPGLPPGRPGRRSAGSSQVGRVIQSGSSHANPGRFSVHLTRPTRGSTHDPREPRPGSDDPAKTYPWVRAVPSVRRNRSPPLRKDAVTTFVTG